MTNLNALQIDQLPGAKDVGISRLLDAPGTVRSKLVSGGRQVGPPQRLWESPRVAQIKPEKTPDIYVYKIEDAIVHGPSVIEKDGHAIASSLIYPYYVEYYYSRGMQNIDYDLHAHHSRNLKCLDIDSCYVIDNFNRKVYGHYLLEIISKAFIVDRMVDCGHNYPILLRSGAPQWVEERIRAVTPRSVIIRYDAMSMRFRVGKLLIPTWGSWGYIMNDWMRERFQSLPEKIGIQPDGPSSDKIFIKRGSNASYRTLSNATIVEDIALQNGYRIISPAEMPWEEQLSVFSSAQCVAGEYSSALHNTVFSKEGTRVVCLNAVNSVQECLAATHGHKIGYVTPVEGIVTYDPLKPSHSNYGFDPEELRRAFSLDV